jgi:O-acetylhomoserine/O-acetylserine sulfhydrylase-like pyridoxal-dependent enzyme
MDKSEKQASESGVARYEEAGRRSVAARAQSRDAIRRCRFDTIATHGIYSLQEALDFNQGSIVEPIYMSTSQGYRDADELEAALSYRIPTWCYSRIANPSMYYLEGTLALLEAYGFAGDASCTSTSSGMGAIMMATEALLCQDPQNRKQPINFVSSCRVYGGTFQLFNVRWPERGVECRWVADPANLDEWASKIDEHTRFVYGEFPSNPGQSVFDIAKVAEIAHARGVPLIIDSTVATPALLRPLQHGADVVVQSVTKSLAASGMVVAGAVIARKNMACKCASAEMCADFASWLKLWPQRDMGPNLSPASCIQALNDVRTLRTRMDKVSRSTMAVARFLEKHPRIEQVDYLGLESHPLHELASKYMWLADAEHDDLYGKPQNRYGHLMSFRVKDGAAAARGMFDAMQRIWRATDLGRVKSVATIPAISTHSQQGEEARRMADIPPNLVRLCVGVEHPDDVIADLEQALAAIGSRPVQVPAVEFSAGGASSSVLRK